mgnify:CR=1 FL=1
MIGELTLLEHNNKYPATGSRGKFHNIRIHARKVMKDAKIDKACKICNYNKYVEVCHIKAIADFTLDSKINEINSLSNLIYLCPNHHWELDNNLLKL